MKECQHSLCLKHSICSQKNKKKSLVTEFLVTNISEHLRGCLWNKVRPCSTSHFTTIIFI